MKGKTWQDHGEGAKVMDQLVVSFSQKEQDHANGFLLCCRSHGEKQDPCDMQDTVSDVYYYNVYDSIITSEYHT